MRSDCSTLRGSPTPTLPATNLTSGEKCRIRLSRAAGSLRSLKRRQYSAMSATAGSGARVGSVIGFLKMPPGHRSVNLGGAQFNVS